MTMSSVNVPITPDKIVEEDETFNVMLSIPSSVSKGITAGTENKVVVTITDSTGKYNYYIEYIYICIAIIK